MYAAGRTLIGAAVIIVLSFAFVTLAAAAAHAGHVATGGFLKNFGFLLSLILSMPFWLTKGQPWKAQTLVIGGTLLLMIGIAIL